MEKDITHFMLYDPLFFWAMLSHGYLSIFSNLCIFALLPLTSPIFHIYKNGPSSVHYQSFWDLFTCENISLSLWRIPKQFLEVYAHVSSREEGGPWGCITHQREAVALKSKEWKSNRDPATGLSWLSSAEKLYYRKVQVYASPPFSNWYQIVRTINCVCSDLNWIKHWLCTKR